MAPGKETIKIQLKMKQLDDVFHRLIIALERLEAFLEIERLKADVNAPMPTTAVGSSRDLHNDTQNIPNKETLLGEVQLQLTALYYQTKFDDRELFNNTQRYFLKDLLQWYGGRGTNIPYNEVDAFVLPIIVSLSRQVKSVADIMLVVKKYVATLKTISDYDEHQRYHAVISGWTAYQIAMERNAQETQAFLDADQDVPLTSHIRSSEAEGYKRLYLALTSMYDQPLPAKVLCRTISTYLPEVTEQLPNLTEDNIDKLIAYRLSNQHDAQLTEILTKDEEISERSSDNPQSAESVNNPDLRKRVMTHRQKTGVDEPQQATVSTDCQVVNQTEIHSQTDECHAISEVRPNISEETKSNIDVMESDSRDSFVIDETQVNTDSHSEEVANEEGVNNLEQPIMHDTIDASSSLIEDGDFDSNLENDESLNQEKRANEEESFFTRLAKNVQNRFSKK